MNYLEKCPHKDPNIASRKIADEIILVPIQHNADDLGCIYTLNEVGAFSWDLIDGIRQVNEIKEKIASEFEVSPEEAESDLIEFLLQLEEIGCVTMKVVI